jgi:hypothetical protein
MCPLEPDLITWFEPGRISNEQIVKDDGWMDGWMNDGRMRIISLLRL